MISDNEYRDAIHPDRLYPVLLILFVAVALPRAFAADATGYVSLTSDYVFRGVTYSDGHLALQGGVDLAFESGAYAGVWASSADVSGGSTQRDLAVNYYLGYAQEAGADWTLDANVVAWSFPGADGPIDYDFVEYSAAVNYRDRAWLEYSFSPDLYNTSLDTHNLEVYAEWPLPRALIFGVGAGYYDVSALSGVGYGHWQAGVTRGFGRFSIDLRYHDTNRAVRIVSDAERAGERVVLSLRYPFDIKTD